MTFSRKAQPIATTYSIKRETLQSYNTVKDLGVVLHKDLNFAK